MGGIISLAEPVPVQREENMLSRPRLTRPRRTDDNTRVSSTTTAEGLKVPSRDSSKTSTAPVAANTPSSVPLSRRPVESMLGQRKLARLAPTQRQPHITTQMKTKLAAARSEQVALASKEAAKAVPIPEKSSRRYLSPRSDEEIVSPISSIEQENWPLPPSFSSSPKDSVMRSSGDTQQSRPSHKQMTVTEPNHGEDDASVIIPSSNKPWEAIIEELNPDSDADSFKTASDPELLEHGSIQIGLVRCDQQVHSANKALRPPPLKTHCKKADESVIVPLPGPPMAVQKLGAPDTWSRDASLVTLNQSREAAIPFQDRTAQAHFTEPKVLIHITGEPARIPKVPSKDEFKALVARGMREFQEYAAKQDQRLPEKSPVPAESPAPRRPPPSQKAPQPKKSQPLLQPERPLKVKPPQKTEPRTEPKANASKKPQTIKEPGLKDSVRGALGALKKRTSRVWSFETTPGPKRRSLAILLQPQTVRQSVEDISASVATGRGRPLKRDNRRDSRARLQKSQKSVESVAISPRTSRFFKRSSGSVRNSALRLSIHDRMPSLPDLAELEGEGPYYELAAFDADGNIRRDRSLSPIRVWNNGGAMWLAANKRMNETSSTLALVPGVGMGNVSRRHDWAEEYRKVIAT